VKEMRQLWTTGCYTLRQLSAIYGLNWHRVQKICSGRAWKHIA
jgi:hypothetical protein